MKKTSVKTKARNTVLTLSMRDQKDADTCRSQTMMTCNTGKQKGNFFGTEKQKNICSDDYTGHFQFHNLTISTLAPLDSQVVQHPSKHNKTNYDDKHSETRHSVIIVNKKAVRSKCIS